MENRCIRCKGKGLCGKPCKILARFTESAPIPKLHFSGISPPEVFVGRIGYPNVNSGILAPSEEGYNSNLSTAEDWSASNLNIANVLRLRAKLIYGRANSHIKKQSRIRDVTKELAMTHKPTSTEFFLKKMPVIQFTSDSVFRPMTNPAPIKKVLLEENTKVIKKIDYLVNDSDAKATTALSELYKSNIRVDHLQKLLSVGSLGVKASRRMVPTRWSITAVDDTISKQLLERIRYYPEINEIMLLSGNYVGNYIEILILPGSFAFEGIEAWDSESTYGGEATDSTNQGHRMDSSSSNPTDSSSISTPSNFVHQGQHYTTFSQDYEGFRGRKTYATNVTGGYYAMRLPVTEYLNKIKKQATVLVFRRITSEYYAPLGVGVVREATRRSINSPPVVFDSIDEALSNMVTRIGFSPEIIREKSWTLKEYGKQKSLKEWF